MEELLIKMPKERKDKLRNEAKKMGLTMNGLVNLLIIEQVGK